MKADSIKHAEVVHITERNDVPCADVKVILDGRKDELLVIFTPLTGNEFDMTHIYLKDAEQELDWYDNDLHEAYKDVTSDMFQSEGMREEFKERIVSFGTVSMDLQVLFQADERQNSSLLH